MVGERGLTLSGGQRQRVALARALLTDPRILVLDDATSAVDARIEEEIHATLRRVMQGRTTLLVAHRRSTLRLADRIVVVDDGRVVDQGTHDELHRPRCRTYRLLLAGPGDDIDDEVDARSPPTGRPGRRRVDGVTPSLWPPAPSGVARRRRRPGPRAPAGRRAAVGADGRRRRLEWRRRAWRWRPRPSCSPRSPPSRRIRDVPDVDVGAESDHDPSFTLRRFLRPYRRPLAVGLVLVLVDAAATLAGPVLDPRRPRRRGGQGVRGGARRRRRWPSCAGRPGRPG